MAKERKVSKQNIDAKTFQKPLAELANTIALKVEREGVKLIKPAYVAIDIYVMIRQVLKTYDLFFYLNADERRKSDPFWNVGYSAAILPLVRCMIDCLYNITSLLENPAERGRQFRASGFQQILAALAADEKRYGGDPGWDNHIEERRRFVDLNMRILGISAEDVASAIRWPTLSAYLRPKKNIDPTPHQRFLRKLTFGFWHEYSGIAHATFQGLSATAAFYSAADVPYEDREQFEAVSEIMISQHLTRVVGVLLCVLTEVQAHFRFDGARINERLQNGWDAVLRVPEIKELYDERYFKLMTERGHHVDS